MNSLELLAPAGGMAELKAAVQSGADAVYLGATAFSARHGAGNFTEAEMRSAVDYAHIYGVKVHCAINTLIKDTELEDAVNTAICAGRCGVDALIIQDIGLGRYLKKLMPQMELHASTQMTVTSLEGVRYLEENGFSRVVLARELSLEEIAHIAKNASAEIEVFVHGAICMSYSGQCLMSSILGGRSGNRGKCAQPCRLPYALLENGTECDNGYILSPKDMALINHLEALKKAGVKSLKIEGRLKSPEYVSTVVGVYRKYLDKPQKVTDADYGELRAAFSRSGFTDGYLTGRLGASMMAHNNPANNSGSIYTDAAKERAQGGFIRKIPVDIYATLVKGDILRLTAIIKDGPCVSCEGTMAAETATGRPIDRERMKEQLSKLGDTPFVADTLMIDIDDGISLPIKEINDTRRRMAQALCHELAYRDEKQIADIPSAADGDNGTRAADDGSAGDVHTDDMSSKEVYLTAEVTTKEQGQALIAIGGMRRIFAPANVAKALAGTTDVELVTKTSEILSDEEISTDSVSVSSLNALYKYRDIAKYGDWRLNVYNSISAMAFRGLDCVTVSPELNLRDIKSISQHTKGIELEVIGYGRLPLMLMKNCPIKAMGKCRSGKATYTLRDRKGIEFPFMCTRGCVGVLLNSKPVYTADILEDIKGSGVDCLRLCFTTEAPAECAEIAKTYILALSGAKVPGPEQNAFTRAHLRRGV